MTTHHFQPTQYHTTFGSHPPALHIAPGDSVVTSTIDASGTDASGKVVGGWPNPQTGPFYIEGAQPGDLLQVKLERLTPSRATGYSKSVLAEHVVDPEHVRLLPQTQRMEWRIETGQGTLGAPEGASAFLTTPMGKLNQLAFPLRPMLGCLGVAPAGGQAISSATSGHYGGNMDYRGFTAGVTVFFPVFVPGALFFLGDGHALQGDGEVIGTGIETTFEVEFSVDLLTGKKAAWPRGENAEYLFTVGNGRPLDQALAFATTEMFNWLMADYGLDAHGASLLLGMLGEYDLGNIYDPAYTMVCKLPKRVLAGV